MKQRYTTHSVFCFGQCEDFLEKQYEILIAASLSQTERNGSKERESGRNPGI